MERVAYAFRIASGQEADVRAVAAEMQASGGEYGRSRQDLGLTGLSVWLQPTTDGSLVLVVMEGDLDRYFESARRELGIDSWFREKILKWTGSDSETAAVYAYPQSEELFSWSNS